MRSLMLLFLLPLFFCCGCQSLVNVSQKYPAEYSAITPDESVAVLRKYFNGSEKASGAQGYSFDIKRDSFSCARKTRVVEERTSSYTKYRYVMRTQNYLFSDIGTVVVDRYANSLASNKHDPFEYGERMVSMYYKDGIKKNTSRYFFGLRITRDDQAPFLLALSKLAPQAKIFTLDEERLPAEVNIKKFLEQDPDALRNRQEVDREKKMVEVVRGYKVHATTLRQYESDKMSNGWKTFNTGLTVTKFSPSCEIYLYETIETIGVADRPLFAVCFRGRKDDEALISIESMRFHFNAP